MRTSFSAIKALLWLLPCLLRWRFGGVAQVFGPWALSLAEPLRGHYVFPALDIDVYHSANMFAATSKTSISALNLCSACSGLELQRSDFERPPFEPKSRYNKIVLKGTLGYLRTNKNLCLLCRLIEHALSKNEESSWGMHINDTEWEMAWRQVNDEYDPVTNEAENFYSSGLYTRLRTEGSYTDHCIQLVDEASTDGFLRARLIPESINADKVRGWVKRCMEEHGEGCKTSYLHIGSHPATETEFIIIDVNAKCLVNLPTGESYVALSYVWGHASQLTTSKSLVSEFRKIGAFNENLPRTIHDAIDLSRDLGFRYLWVDSLCIIQDDDETKGLIIAKMDAVYGHAALTIVAASGLSVEAGLQGWKSSPSDRQFLTENIAPGLRLGVLPSFDRSIMQSPHGQRGWTYQEGCLSRRCLVILEGKAFFSCRAAVWREDVNAEVDDVVPLEGANTLGRTPSEWPLRRYAQHVGAYTMRQLTYQSDALNAFAGIERALTASMAGTRMFYGLPAAVFDWAVLWTGSPGLRSLKRRDEFPSWAWAAWQGDILMTPDIFSSFDHEWLLERTWIEWYLATEEGEVVLIWDPDRDQSVVSRLCIENNESFDDEWKDLDEIRSHHGDENQDSKFPNIDKTDDQDDEDDKGDDDDDDDDNDDDEACPTYGIPTDNNPYGRCVQQKLLSLFPPRPISNRSGIYPHLHYRPLLPGTLIFTTIVASFSLNVIITALTTTPTAAIHSSHFHPLQDTANRVCGLIWDDQAPQSRKDTESKIEATTTAIASATSLASLSSSGLLPPTSQTQEILLLSHAGPGSLQALKGTTAAAAAGRGILADNYRLCQTREESVRASAAAMVDGTAREEGRREEMKEERGDSEVDGEDILGEWHAWDFFNVMLVRRVERGGAEVKADDIEEMVVYEREGIGLLHCRALAHAFEPAPQWRTVGLR